MPTRIAAILSIIAFTMCLVIGGIQVDNPFTTTVWRAIVAMAGTFFVGLIVGTMGQKMLSENVAQQEKKLKELEAKPETKGR